MKLMSTNAIEAYYEGKRAGIKLFAWWKDGEQFVGTTGCTVKRALEEVDHEEKVAFRLFVSSRSGFVGHKIGRDKGYSLGEV